VWGLQEAQVIAVATAVAALAVLAWRSITPRWRLAA
jgi:hypothetical protein